MDCRGLLIKIKSTDGLTLIEVLTVATLLIAVLVVMIFALTDGINAVGRSKHRNSAVTIAQEKMETIRNMSYDDITTANLSDDTKQTQGLTFTRHVDVEVPAPTSEIANADEHIKKITVTVSWTETRGENRNVSLITYRTRKL